MKRHTDTPTHTQTHTRHCTTLLFFSPHWMLMLLIIVGPVLSPSPTTGMHECLRRHPSFPLSHFCLLLTLLLANLVPFNCTEHFSPKTPFVQSPAALPRLRLAVDVSAAIGVNGWFFVCLPLLPQWQLIVVLFLFLFLTSVLIKLMANFEALQMKWPCPYFLL